jgi:hypothetical protein
MSVLVFVILIGIAIFVCAFLIYVFKPIGLIHFFQNASEIVKAFVAALLKHSSFDSKTDARSIVKQDSVEILGKTIYDKDQRKAIKEGIKIKKESTAPTAPKLAPVKTSLG